MKEEKLIGGFCCLTEESVGVLNGVRQAMGDKIVCGVDGEYWLPPCITKLLSMRYPETPTPAQSFYLACWLLDKGYSLDDCKRVFKEIFQEHYNEDTADTHLKLIKIKECRPYHCFMVEYGLGICSPECPYYNGT
jgi:hypothetical protein